MKDNWSLLKTHRKSNYCHENCKIKVIFLSHEWWWIHGPMQLTSLRKINTHTNEHWWNSGNLHETTGWCQCQHSECYSILQTVTICSDFIGPWRGISLHWIYNCLQRKSLMTKSHYQYIHTWYAYILNKLFLVNKLLSEHISTINHLIFLSM